MKTLIQGPTLNQAWGIAAAPANFGPLSNTLLVSNNSVGGTINAFDPLTGKYVGSINDQSGKRIVLNNLWGIAFGGGAANNGARNELFVTVGPGIGPAELARHLCKNRLQATTTELTSAFATIVSHPYLSICLRGRCCNPGRMKQAARVSSASGSDELN